MSKEQWWNDTERGKPKYSEKQLSSATLPTTYPTCTDLQSKPGLRGKKPVGVFYLKTQSVPRSKHTHSRFIQTSQLMLYREIIAVCSEIHTKHINTPCRQHVLTCCRISPMFVQTHRDCLFSPRSAFFSSPSVQLIVPHKLLRIPSRCLYEP